MSCHFSFPGSEASKERGGVQSRWPAAVPCIPAGVHSSRCTSQNEVGASSIAISLMKACHDSLFNVAPAIDF